MFWIIISRSFLPHSTVGRRSKDVAFVKVKEHNELVKEINKRRQNDEAEIRDNIPVLVENITVAPVDELLQVETTSCKSHKKTDKELEMLQEAFSHPTDLPTKKLLENLFEINNSDIY
jgi:hypothetical protein